MVTFANLTSGSARNDNTTYVTASISPGANRLVLLAISTFETSATQPTTPSVTGCGLTWVLVGSFDHDTAGGDRSTGFVFRAMGTPTPGAVTAVFPAAVSRCCWNIDEADGVNTGGTDGSAAVVQFVTNTGTNLTTITGTLAAFADPANAAYGAFGVQASSGTAFVPGIGFTTLGTANGQSFALCYTESDGNDPTVDGSWAASGRAGVLAIEVAAGGVAAQNLTPSSIPTSEAFGTSVITTGPVSVSPSSITSVEAFGIPAVTPGTVTLSPAAIASDEAFGAAVVTVGAVTLSPAGTPSAEAFGTATVTPGPVTVSPVGIPSAEAFGTPVVSGAGQVLIVPVSIESAEAFGTPSLTTGPVTITPTGIPSGEAFGTPTLLTGLQVVVEGIPSLEAFGTPTITTGPVTLSPLGIPSAEAFGIPSLSVEGEFTPASDPEAHTSPMTATARTVTPTATATTTGDPMKTGDLEPAWVIEISDDANQADLTTVVSWRLIGLRSGTLVVDDTLPTVAVDPLNTWQATVTHEWVTGETDHADDFRLVGAVVAMWPGARPQTFPGRSVVHVDFEKALA